MIICSLPTVLAHRNSCLCLLLSYTAIAHRLQNDPSSYLKKMYFDAVSYSVPALQSLVTQVSACALACFVPARGAVLATHVSCGRTVHLVFPRGSSFCVASHTLSLNYTFM
jgi:hypothetical protein